MQKEQPWILNFFDMPKSLVNEEPDTSLQIICHLLFSDENLAEQIFDVVDMLIPATIDTIYMVFLSSFFAVLFGLPLGVILTITKKKSLMPSPIFNKVLGTIVNTIRSFPFIILIVLLLPLSKIVIGSSIGPNAATLSLSIAAIPFVARLFENALEEVNKGIIEATLSLGASKLEAIFMMIAESMPSLINAMTITIISIIGFSAMAGSVGGGGLGDLAIKLGFYNSRDDMLYSCVVILIIMVQITQSIGDYLSKMLRTHDYGIFKGVINMIYKIVGRTQQ